MFLFRRKRARIIKNSKPDRKPDKTAKTEIPAVSFTSHISKYIGKTVTVFVNAGGPSGCGLTGILSDVDNTSLKLIVSIGPPPSCPLNNQCHQNFARLLHGCSNYYHDPCFDVRHFYGFYWPQTYKPYFQIGSVAYILLSSITAFVHNSI